MLPRASAVRSTWKIIFSISALLEIRHAVLIPWMQGRGDADDGDPDDPSNEYCKVDDANGDGDEAAATSLTISRAAAPLFCALCVIESFVRAVEARRVALDSRALGDLEETLLRAARQNKSLRKLSSVFFHQPAQVSDSGYENATKRVSRALR